MTKATRLVIIDYGMGNLWSVHSALRYFGIEPRISGNPSDVSQADALILPGVGSFRKAMERLRALGLEAALHEAVRQRGTKILGICLGMQLLAETGTEDGLSSGLGFVRGTVERFPAEKLGGLKVPHIGFNEVRPASDSRLFAGMAVPSDFYFVHSYRLPATESAGLSSFCRYGRDFVAAYEHENIFATQFHPEKSQTNGLIVLRNFLAA